MKNKQYAVTGAFGYSGKYITQQLLENGVTVRTLTNSGFKTNSNIPNPFGTAVNVHPFNFDKPDKLVESLQGVDVLINTYWVRFNHANFTHAQAVANTNILFNSAKTAGVKKIVHISISNPDINSPLEYFRCKAKMEQMLINTGVDYTILRPTVLFGEEDVLLNNIAWGLRYTPVFGVFGDGNYKIQPIFVHDLAKLAIEYSQKSGSQTINANGAEAYTYRELAQTIAKILGLNRWIISVPPTLGYYACALLGKVMGDVLLTRPEVEGLMAGTLYVDTPPTGPTKLSDWVLAHKDTLGKKYASELSRRK